MKRLGHDFAESRPGVWTCALCGLCATRSQVRLELFNHCAKNPKTARAHQADLDTEGVMAAERRRRGEAKDMH